MRQTCSAPLVEAFGIWLEQQRVRVSPKSRLGEKLAYIANHWNGLQIFLTDGRVEMDSNPVENAIRSIALGRKNALFAGHDEDKWSIHTLSEDLKTLEQQDKELRLEAERIETEIAKLTWKITRNTRPDTDVRRELAGISKRIGVLVGGD